MSSIKVGQLTLGGQADLCDLLIAEIDKELNDDQIFKNYKTTITESK